MRVVLLATVAFFVAGEATALDGGADATPRAAPSAIVLVDCPLPLELQEPFTTAARKTGLPLNLLVAIAYEESRFDPDALSPAGAIGLLQVMPETADEVGLDPADPRSNVLAGARYLERMLARFGSLDLALAAYNAGPTAVKKAGGAPSGETLTYVANVRSRALALTGCR